MVRNRSANHYNRAGGTRNTAATAEGRHDRETPRKCSAARKANRALSPGYTASYPSTSSGRAGASSPQSTELPMRSAIESSTQTASFRKSHHERFSSFAHCSCRRFIPRIAWGLEVFPAHAALPGASVPPIANQTLCFLRTLLRTKEIVSKAMRASSRKPVRDLQRQAFTAAQHLFVDFARTKCSASNGCGRTGSEDPHISRLQPLPT